MLTSTRRAWPTRCAAVLTDVHVCRHIIALLLHAVWRRHARMRLTPAAMQALLSCLRLQQQSARLDALVACSRPYGRRPAWLAAPPPQQLRCHY